jgi:16S rRNA (uracil1498-N3)-methyltransferase
MRAPTTSFLVRPSEVDGDTLRLIGDEARHAARVLRHRPGDEMVVVDGEGGWFRAQITAVEKGLVEAKVIERRRNVGEASLKVELAVGIPKSRSRLDTMVEKVTEIGVASIRLLTTERSERPGVDLSRIRRVAVSAVKQSGRSRLPEIQPICPLDTVVSSSGDEKLFVLACHEAASESEAAWADARRAAASSKCRVVVGPEGGFSTSEIQLMVGHGVQVVGLGPRRLRTETAGIVAVAKLLLG